ncbi:MAG: hypothetical protein M0P19_11145 [Nevskia sp.]|jgi:hypothetical protein|nr:hypothetical protein [Nevskia sp.]MCK9383979.1 hypothetical protein [Nevskia sp.]
MLPTDRRLLHEITAAVVLKLIALAVLWLLFVRGNQVEVDQGSVAAAIHGSAEPPQSSRE